MIPGVDYIRILPEIVLSLFGMVVMIIDPLLPEHDNRRSLGVLSAIGCVCALLAVFLQAAYPGMAFFHMIRVDGFSVFFHAVVILVALAATLSSFEYLEVQQIRLGEYYGLILLGTVGMCLMSSAIELVLIFIALEISSIATYVLAGFRRRSAASAEASLKYFLLGSFATAFFLYGVALMFGATGSTNVDDIARALSRGAPTLAYLAMALMFVGLGFKVATAPFQVWTPDVYEGAPAPVVGLMSTAPKAAAFAVLLRVLYGTAGGNGFWGAAQPGWFWMIWVSAALSMTLGNLGALVQTNVKRLLAYSSIAHAGYLMVAFASFRDTSTGISAAMFYAAAYAAMNVGAFAVVSHFAGAGEKYVSLDDYAGLGRRSPILAAALSVFLLSLIGIPITGGFLAKFYVFTAALQSSLVGLTIIGVLNSGVGAYYYLRLIVVMYMREPRDEAPVPPIPFSAGLAMVLSLIATIYLGVLPGRLLNFTLGSARELMR